MTQPPIPGFRDVPRTGVIYVMHRATELGLSYDAPDWANLGQGAPETGPLPGAPPRIETDIRAMRDVMFEAFQRGRTD